MGAAASNPEKCCLHIQQSLEDLAADNAPGLIRENFGMFDALRSANNTRGFTAKIKTDAFPGKGKFESGTGVAVRPKLEIEYLKPVKRTAKTSRDGLCVDATQSTDPYAYLDVTVDNTRALDGKMTKDDFDELCHGPSERLAIDLRNTAHDLLRAINEQLVTQAYAVMGNYMDGTASGAGATAKDLPLINGAGYINSTAMAAVKSQYRRMHTSDAPIVVGGDILGIWMDARTAGGLGPGALGAAGGDTYKFGSDIYLDYDVDPVIQTIETDTLSHALTWSPGGLQLLEWYEYVGYKEEIGKPDYIETTIEIDGVKFDYSLNYDKCTHTWDWELSKVFDLWAIPDIAFTAGAAIWPWNRRLAWTLSCGDFDCANYAI